MECIMKTHIIICLRMKIHLIIEIHLGQCERMAITQVKNEKGICMVLTSVLQSRSSCSYCRILKLLCIFPYMVCSTLPLYFKTLLTGCILCELSIISATFWLLTHYISLVEFFSYSLIRPHQWRIRGRGRSPSPPFGEPKPFLESSQR